MDWFYSKTTKLYVSLMPMKISAKVFRVAKDLGIKLTWDDNGCVTHLTLQEAKRMAEALGMCIMNPSEYWQVHHDAEEEGQKEVLEALESDEFTEFLDRVYVRNDIYIDHPQFITTPKAEQWIAGERICEEIPYGRPGWIYRNEVDLVTGHPTKVHEKSKDSGLIKYWSPDELCLQSKVCLPIRGYVTSVGTISLDLGIPLDSRQPKLMVRLCSKEEPDTSSETDAVIEREMKVIDEGDRIAQNPELYEMLSKELRLSDFISYIKSSKSVLALAMEEGKEVVLCFGHRNPDSDTVVSSFMEAFRQSLINSDPDRVFLPMLQSEAMPAEIREILGDEISDSCLKESEVPLRELMDSGRFHVIFTDQNYQAEYQKYLIAVTDHHNKDVRISENAVKIPSYIQKVGSTASIIGAKILGEGYRPDSELSRILYAAMLMDTENRVAHKMTAWDVRIMDLFKELSGTEDDAALFGHYMDKMLCEENLEVLFFRDYKTYSGFGFSVMKVRGFEQRPDYEENLKVIQELAQAENKRHHFLFTLIKLVNYKEDANGVEKELLTPVFSPNTPEVKKKAVFDALQGEAIRAFPNAVLENVDGTLNISKVGKQFSRKAIAPALEELVTELERYCYVPFLDKYVCRDFLRLEDLPEKLTGKYTGDRKGRVCEITYDEMKELLAECDLEILSLEEYWQVLRYAIEDGDEALYQSMMSADFLEYLDTLCMDGELVNHPHKTCDGYEGEHRKVEIIPAEPALLHPDDIDLKTGLPSKIYGPAEYENKELWRYWSPKEKGTYVFSRSFIFLLGQKCLDGKMLTTESCANLGIRPVRRKTGRTSPKRD